MPSPVLASALFAYRTYLGVQRFDWILGVVEVMFLGIEIGGTKLQLGVGGADSPRLEALTRLDVPPGADARWIREAIVPLAKELCMAYGVGVVGVGFGGPVEPKSGTVVRSHQIPGWEEFPLASWLAEELGVPVRVGNDADCAGLAEALLGAGKGWRYVFYTNIGSGIGGAIILVGRVYTGGKGIAGEIGHLQPFGLSDAAQLDVESLASGWAISRTVRRKLADKDPADPGARILFEVCKGEPERLSVREIAEAARMGASLAKAALDDACRVYGWAIAQVVTLLAPEVVVVGGGVSLIGEELFFQPLRRYVNQFVFPPLRGTFDVVPAALGEEVVVHGAILLAKQGDGILGL